MRNDGFSELLEGKIDAEQKFLQALYFLGRLAFHDRASSKRENLPGCLELQEAEEFIKEHEQVIQQQFGYL